MAQAQTGGGGSGQDARDAVLAIGNFDGLHRGHQAVLAAARAEADHAGCPAILVTFEPHPRLFFSGRDFFRLTPLEVKAAVARALGIDETVVLPFDAPLAGLTAEEFVSRILIERFAARHVVVGYDFHFGKDRAGTPEFLRRAGLLNGFGVTIVEAFADPAGPISSTRVRSALAAGAVEVGNGQLGWSWAVTGAVVGGERRGRELGYPTANMALAPATDLAHGIYAVRYLRPGGARHDGVASFGRRPTFDNGRPLLESFLFDFAGDLYGEEALVAFVAHIRPETKFDSVEALVAAMDADSIEARIRLEACPESEVDRRIGEAWLRPRRT